MSTVRKYRDPVKVDYTQPWVRGDEYIGTEGTSFWQRLREAAGLTREDVSDLTREQGWVTVGQQMDIEGDEGPGTIWRIADLVALAHVYGRSPGELLDACLEEKGCELLAGDMADEGDEGPPSVVVSYLNHRGDRALREITPLRVRYGSTEHHPEPQFLLEVFDHGRNAARTYALKDCDFDPGPYR